MDTTSASSSWSTQGEQVKRSSKYVKNIHNFFITIVLIYIIIYIFILLLSFELKIEWRKQKVLRYEQIKAIQGTLLGFFMEQVIDPRARTTMTLKNSYLVVKRRKIRVARNSKDMSTFVTLLCTYFMHA